MRRTGAVRGIRSDALRVLARTAIEQGFVPSLDGSDHLRLTGPDGRSFTISKTAGTGGRAYWNSRAEARKAGVDV